MKMFLYSAVVGLSVQFALADPVYTIPSGYVRVTAPAAAAGSTTVTAVSANLLKKAEFSGEVTLNDDYSNAADTQTAAISGVTWTATQWTAEPHLAYVTNATTNAEGIGVEEAFLITANTTGGGLTLSTMFDLLADTDPDTIGDQPQFPANTKVVIRKAITLKSLFSQAASSLTSSDSVFLWSGSSWNQYNYNGSRWIVAGNPFTDQGGTIIYPDEGLFISNSQNEELKLTLFGQVPVKIQATTVNQSGLRLLGNRYPIATTLGDLKVEEIEGWDNQNDSVYLWNGSAWDQFSYSGSRWTIAGNPFSNAGATAVSANAAIFVSRSSANSGQLNPDRPYDPFAE